MPFVIADEAEAPFLRRRGGLQRRHLSKAVRGDVARQGLELTRIRLEGEHRALRTDGGAASSVKYPQFAPTSTTIPPGREVLLHDPRDRRFVEPGQADLARDLIAQVAREARAAGVGGELGRESPA